MYTNVFVVTYSASLTNKDKHVTSVKFTCSSFRLLQTIHVCRDMKTRKLFILIMNECLIIWIQSPNLNSVPIRTVHFYNMLHTALLSTRGLLKTTFTTMEVWNRSSNNITIVMPIWLPSHWTNTSDFTHIEHALSFNRIPIQTIYVRWVRLCFGSQSDLHST